MNLNFASETYLESQIFTKMLMPVHLQYIPDLNGKPLSTQAAKKISLSELGNVLANTFFGVTPYPRSRSQKNSYLE